MTEELNYKEEIDDLLEDKTESEISEEFLNEYRKICWKYRRDFWIQSGERPQVVPIKLKEDIKPNAVS